MATIQRYATTLIIGAGAHVPYGFPTSDKIREDLREMHPDFKGSDKHTRNLKKLLDVNNNTEIKDLSLRTEMKRILNPIASSPEGGGSEKESPLADFIYSFLHSQCSTLDKFLSANNKRDDRLMGKILIALLIDLYERNNPLTRGQLDWIQWLVEKRLSAEVSSSFVRLPINIITFNYDTLLERCLAARLQHYYGFSKEEAIRAVEGLGIIHVYGRVGSFDENYVHPLNHIDDIKIIGHDVKYMSQMMWKITEVLMHTNVVYFLGFGFDPENVKIILEQGSIIRNIEFCSTNIGLEPSKIDKIKSIYGTDIAIYKDVGDVDCKKLISKHVPIKELIVE